MRVEPFLMFEGRAEEAMTFYTATIPRSAIVEIVRYGANGPGPAGTVMKGVMSIGGQIVRCTDSFVHHAFTFTPSFSFWIDCDSEEEIARLAAALADGGSQLMPLDNYGFSRRFAWVADRFGVSWQVNLP